MRRELTPRQNTRFSGVILLESSFSMGEPTSLEFVRNEEARNPLPSSFESLVSAANGAAPRRASHISAGDHFIAEPGSVTLEFSAMPSPLAS